VSFLRHVGDVLEEILERIIVEPPASLQEPRELEPYDPTEVQEAVQEVLDRPAHDPGRLVPALTVAEAEAALQRLPTLTVAEAEAALQRLQPRPWVDPPGGWALEALPVRRIGPLTTWERICQWLERALV
jgi:hypothetical protein